MISLRKAMDHQRDELLRTALECCRTVVKAMAQNGARVCPQVADTFQQNLAALGARLSAATAPGDVASTEQAIGLEIEGWSARASEYYRRKAGEIREVMLAMNEAAKAIAERDERYHEQFTQVSERLHQIDNLEDLSQIKQIVNTSAGELRSSVDRMVADGKQSVASLKAQLAAYEQRLEEAERASTTDALTGLLNRAGIEREVAVRMRAGHPFSMVVLDLNGFKQINDTHGHAAGDALLAAFSRELKGQFRALDAVGRWGGDEFVVLLDCPAPEAASRMEPVHRWVLGEYPLPGAGRVTIGAATGIAEWRPGRTAAELFSQADQAMYGNKRR